MVGFISGSEIWETMQPNILVPIIYNKFADASISGNVSEIGFNMMYPLF